MGADNTFGETNFNPEKVKPKYILCWGSMGTQVIFTKDFTNGFWGKNNKPLDLNGLDIVLLHTFKNSYKKANAKTI